jgi:hypothetical protein
VARRCGRGEMCSTFGVGADRLDSIIRHTKLIRLTGIVHAQLLC